ncbi:MAG: hypothetical protein LUE98_13055 [Tannerellaceae bacterium]|nr:hypothetical protein [Tannerellaceae bacterium]
MNRLYKGSYLLLCIALLGCNGQPAKTSAASDTPDISVVSEAPVSPVPSVSLPEPTSSGYKVEDFSDYYYAIVEINPDDIEEVFSRASVIVYSKETGKELIRIESDELGITLRDGKVEANVKQLPYGEQSIIICGDFNFDGRMDIAIQDGQNSAYHGPSYQIYLQGDNRELIHSAAFTSLAQDYLGMFDVDPENERLHTMTKSGCCWHQFSEFAVKNNVPEPIRVVEINNMADRYYTTEITVEEWNENGSNRETEIFLVPEQLREEDILFSFTMAHNGKTVYFLSIRSDKVNYFIAGKENRIELDFFYEVLYEDFDFYYNEKDEVYFTTVGANYTLYEKADPDKGTQYGIRVKTGGKEYDYPADPSTVKGSLSQLGTYTNLIGPG